VAKKIMENSLRREVSSQCLVPCFVIKGTGDSMPRTSQMMAPCHTLVANKLLQNLPMDQSKHN